VNEPGIRIQYLRGVGPRKAALLERLGIRSIRDALQYLPFRYEDRGVLRKIRDLRAGELQSVEGRVVSAELIERGRRGSLFRGVRGGGLSILEVSVSDATGAVKAKWFNQPYLKKRFPRGAHVVLSGTPRTSRYGSSLEMENPDYEHLSGDGSPLVHAARVVPVYRVTEGLSARQLRSIVFQALEGHLRDVADPLPEDVRLRQGLPPLAESLRNIHFPPPGTGIGELNAWRTPWQRRMAFEELFLFEAGLAVMRRELTRERGLAFRSDGGLRERLLRSLPFALTPAQRRVSGEISADMESPHPMHRLLQGDVGSGKTVVALLALLRAVECGYQAALMAPTEILAEQHYLTLKRLAGGLPVRIVLLTGGTAERPLTAIASGEADLVVGTHAVLEEKVVFGKLGLVVIDEQHRFGVRQRAVMRLKGERPDVLIMTATPIPRTLSLTLYGDLDYSVIDELPPGRTPVATELCPEAGKARLFEAIGEEVRRGGQAYVVYPVIEESEKTDLRSAEVGYEGLLGKFPAMRVALIHGRLPAAEKEEVMGRFKAGEIDILVTTTVIEVGVDVPNASLMVIVHAERFGLAQLHQLRGRVGRGRRASRCILLHYGALSEAARRRLEAMRRSTDGFALAQEDLAIRGPGEFLGTRQSGVPELRVADLLRDGPLVEPARREAFALVARDPELDASPLLREALQRFWRGKMELFKTG
jgi:ATP-dependent DNA helicase RecG